jgi:D-proline reductase (dithiol) PrdB
VPHGVTLPETRDDEHSALIGNSAVTFEARAVNRYALGLQYATRRRLSHANAARPGSSRRLPVPRTPAVLLESVATGAQTMKPIDYVPAINDYYQGLGYPEYDWTINSDAPFTPLTKPLGECRVSMLTSGGISHTSRPPFEPTAKNNLRVDAVDPSAAICDFDINDAYYDTRDAGVDLNVVFPIERLRELAAEGVIGSVAERLWSGFMGRIYNRTPVIEEVAPALARELGKDEVDLMIMVPA